MECPICHGTGVVYVDGKVSQCSCVKHSLFAKYLERFPYKGVGDIDKAPVIPATTSFIPASSLSFLSIRKSLLMQYPTSYDYISFKKQE